MENKSDIYAQDIQLEEQSSQYTICIENQKEKIQVPVGGAHFILNSLCAILTGKILNIPLKEIKRGIETFQLTKNRMEVIDIDKGIKIINDAYNSSVESVKASLKYMSQMKANRRIAVLGDILETGSFAKEIHETVGKIVCENKIDILICSGENAKYIVKSAKENTFNEKNIYYFENKNEIVRLLKEIELPGDVILVKASNGMRFFDIVEEIKK